MKGCLIDHRWKFQQQDNTHIISTHLLCDTFICNLPIHFRLFGSEVHRMLYNTELYLYTFLLISNSQ